MYKMTLADGNVVEFSGVNGNNFIAPDQKEMDTDIFTDESLEYGTVEDDEGNVYDFTNLSFVQQQKQLSGDYYICFYEKTEQDIVNEAVEELLIDLAEIAVSGGDLELEDIPESFQDAVRVRLDDSKWKDK